MLTLQLKEETSVISTHQCKRQEIDWDEKPLIGASDENIYWQGICSVCKRRVYEIYCQQSEIYDELTDKEIDQYPEASHG